jgi:riboflavin kinase/FMN adenylyltransferase
MIADQTACLHPMTSVHRENSLRLAGSVVSIGSFDGVHKGHQALLRALSRAAAARGVASVVYTFDPPPKVVFGKALLLTDAVEKLRRISHFGIDHVVMARFDAEYAARPPEDFLRELAQLSPREVWVGDDFRFGARRAGDVTLLERNFRVRVIDEFTCAGGDRVSSTRLRALFAAGCVEDAQELHGWPRNAPWAVTSISERQAREMDKRL